MFPEKGWNVMDYQNLYYHKTHYPYRAAELQQRADRERLASIAVSTHHQMRFYYPAMASMGRWLMATGLRLQKRYGELTEFPAASSHTAPRNA